jgi:hypothetical protein
MRISSNGRRSEICDDSTLKLFRKSETPAQVETLIPCISDILLTAKASRCEEILLWRTRFKCGRPAPQSLP